MFKQALTTLLLTLGMTAAGFAAAPLPTLSRRVYPTRQGLLREVKFLNRSSTMVPRIVLLFDTVSGGRRGHGMC